MRLFTRTRIDRKLLTEFSTTLAGAVILSELCCLTIIPHDVCKNVKISSLSKLSPCLAEILSSLILLRIYRQI